MKHKSLAKYPFALIKKIFFATFPVMGLFMHAYGKLREHGSHLHRLLVNHRQLTIRDIALVEIAIVDFLFNGLYYHLKKVKAIALAG